MGYLWMVNPSNLQDWLKKISSMKGNLKMESSMGKDRWHVVMEIFTLDNGEMIRNMAMEFSFSWMVTCTKGNSWMTHSMGKEFLNGTLVQNIREHF